MTARQPSELSSVVQHVAPASKTTTITPATGVDCAGYQWARFLIDVGAMAASPATSIAFKIQESSDSGGSPDTFADVTDAASAAVTTANDNAIHVIEVNLGPRERYLRCVGTFTGSAVTLVGITCELFHADRDSRVADSNVTTA